MKVNLLIVGGGITGVSLARASALSNLFDSIRVLEKESVLGFHSSTRNSGVIHAGFYYTENSLRARQCALGNSKLRDYCQTNNLPLRKCGKVVVSKNSSEDDTLSLLFDRGRSNGCNLELHDSSSLSDFEPFAKTCNRFLWSPNTWTANPQSVINNMRDECLDMGVQFSFYSECIRVDSTSLTCSDGVTYEFDIMINACGGNSLDIAKLSGFVGNLVNLPFKGLYLRSVHPVADFKTHIYPVPDIKKTFLGIHTTLTCDGHLKLGPTAIPVLTPYSYELFQDLSVKALWSLLPLYAKLFINNHFGFRNLALSESLNLIKGVIISRASDLTSFPLNTIAFDWYSPGIRAQLYDPNSRDLVKDFQVEFVGNTVHLLNLISPAWTCCMQNADYIIDEIKNRYF